MDASQPLRKLEISIVMPCLNEEKTVGFCIDEALRFINESGLMGEIIVSDNGSLDKSRELILERGAILVDVSPKGYGHALRAGIKKAQGEFVIMADCDGSYNFQHSQLFLDKLKEGHELVIGNRFQGRIETGAMPLLHQHFGNPMMSWLGRRLFGLDLGDFHCGIRGLNRQFFEKLHLRAPGMEFASELIARSALLGGRIAEVPTDLRKDGRNRPPHLRTFRDGFRHLFLRLSYCSDMLMVVPGLIAFFLSFILTLIWPINSILFGLLIASAQYSSFGIILSYFSVSTGLKPRSRTQKFLSPLRILSLALCVGVYALFQIALSAWNLLPSHFILLFIVLQWSLLSFTCFAMSLWQVNTHLSSESDGLLKEPEREDTIFGESKNTVMDSPAP